MQADVLIRQDEEQIRVTHWRVQRFMELGFTVRQAKLLASAEADWHQARLLLARGCGLETAFRLLV